jgi:hypothetical protein
MEGNRSMVLSMRLSKESGKRLKCMAQRHGRTPSDASARLVEEGLRRSEFAFIDFRDSAAGRQVYVQGSTLAVWEVMLLFGSYKGNVSAVAKHLRLARGQGAGGSSLCRGVSARDREAISENHSAGFGTLKRMLPQAREFVSTKPTRSWDAQASSGWTHFARGGGWS